MYQVYLESFPSSTFPTSVNFSEVCDHLFFVGANKNLLQDIYCSLSYHGMQSEYFIQV